MLRAGPVQRDHARADRPGGRDHAVEHAVHAVHLENRAGARGGCTVVHKPAELSPLTARILVEIARSGLPKGVWNLVNGFGEEAGKALTEHPDIKAIGFVGESRPAR